MGLRMRFLIPTLIIIFGSLSAQVSIVDAREIKDEKNRAIQDDRTEKPVRPTAPRRELHKTDRRTDTRKADGRPAKRVIKKKPRPVKPPVRIDHDRIYSKRRVKIRRDYRYFPTYYYHTYYIAPIIYYYYPIGFVLDILPAGYVRIYVSGIPYFYYSGVYFSYVDDHYHVIHAPHGATVSELPVGFIVFTIGDSTYYYVNDTYYIWDQYHDYYVVVAKPAGADAAIASETEGRLYVYPKKGQSEDRQAKDRYACHRWAVKQTGVDPVENEDPLSATNKDNYKRAITACLEGRGYTVR